MTPTIIEKTCGFLDSLAVFTGLRLLCKCQIGESVFFAILRKIIFSCVILAYCFGLILMICLCLPEAKNEKIKITLDAYFSYPLVWGSVILGGLISFVSMNFITNYFSGSNCLKTHCLEVLTIVQLSHISIKRWVHKFMYRSIIAVIIMSGLLISMLFSAAGFLQIPLRMERISYWLSIPEWLGWTAFEAVLFATSVHIHAFVALFRFHCGMARLSFQSYCEKIEKEKAADLTKRKLIFYHGEYYRLIKLVQKMDKAFRLSCFLCMGIAVIIYCFLFFIFARGEGMQSAALLHLISSLCATAFVFSSLAIPAVMLNNQVSRFLQQVILVVPLRYFRYPR